MGFPISNNSQACPTGVTQLIQVAGNYFMDSMSLGVVNVTALAAGRVAGSLYLIDATLAQVYLFIQFEGVAAGVGITPIGQSRVGTNCVWRRGDSVNLFYLNTINTSACLAEFNLYGSNLP